MAQRQNIILKVFYTWSQSSETVKDKTFGREIKWDVPLLEDYAYEFVENVSKNPGSHRFFGIDCPELIPKLKTFEPDAILFFGWNFKSHLKAMRYFYGRIPVWFRGDSTLLDENSGFKTRLRRLVLKVVYRYVDKAFYVGEANKAYFFKHGLSEAQLVYAPHAVNNAHFLDETHKNYNARAAAWKAELGIPNDQITVVFAGKFEAKKQPDVLIEAIIKANQKRKQALRLLMIGNGPMEQQLKKQATGHSYITFLPFQNQSKMPLIYRMSSIFCLPSRGPGETWGLAINEAMASSRPVILSDKVGCARDIVDNGKNGFIFTHTDVNGLVNILESLDLSGLKAMRVHAFTKVQQFNFLKIVETLEREIMNI
ncbi:glycosyltransferase family 4 protein [Winogradskyella forsetii]|uniref:glycosyltransferase family 4 protein n=1 Tax=Winogradskyella forsetii TaxID=2686077 RepID=UPI001C4C2ABA|nr:glycosyltransferase family 4 protein [Winogradskyella forsetii]